MSLDAPGSFSLFLANLESLEAVELDSQSRGRSGLFPTTWRRLNRLHVSVSFVVALAICVIFFCQVYQNALLDTKPYKGKKMVNAARDI